MPHSYTEEDRRRALKLLSESAKRSDDHVPNYARISRDTGVARTTLTRWWTAANPAERGAETDDDGPAPTKPGVGPGWADSNPLLAWAAQMLGLPETAATSTPPDRRVWQVADARAQRDSASSDTARAALTRETNRLLEEHAVKATGGGAETPEQWKERARQYPQLVAEVVDEDPELRAAVLQRLNLGGG